MTVVFFVWPAEQFAAQIITTAYGIPLGDLIQIAVTNPHLSDHGRARWCQIIVVVKCLSDLHKRRIAEIMGRIYAADDIHALVFYGE
jgi:hypothetical protein